MKHYKYCLLLAATVVFYSGCGTTVTDEQRFNELEKLRKTSTVPGKLSLQQCLQYPQTNKKEVIEKYFQLGAEKLKVEILQQALKETKSADAEKELQFQLLQTIGRCAIKETELCDAIGIYAVPVQVEFNIPLALEPLKMPSMDFMEKCVLVTHKPSLNSMVSCLNKFRSDYIKLLSAREAAAFSFQNSRTTAEKIRKIETCAEYQMRLNIIYVWLGIKNLESKELKKLQEKVFVTGQKSRFSRH